MQISPWSLNVPREDTEVTEDCGAPGPTVPGAGVRTCQLPFSHTAPLSQACGLVRGLPCKGLWAHHLNIGAQGTDVHLMTGEQSGQGGQEFGEVSLMPPS